MTPTERDKELRKKVYQKIYHGLTMTEANHYTDWVMQLITADRKRVALEAAIMGAKFGNAAFRQYSIAKPGQPINLDDVRRSGIRQATEWVEREI